MKKILVIVLITLFTALAFMPCINGNFSILSSKNDPVEISIELCGTDESQEKIVQLTKKDTHELEKIFDDMKTKLESVDTNHETIEIFNEVIEELDELELLPKDMTVKEAQQLVTKINCNERILGDDNENFNCFIIGKTSHTGFIEPGLGGDVILRSIIPILKFDNVTIGFGYKKAYVGDPWEYYPASGWIWTKGSNGEVTWSGGSLWGNLGKKSWSEQDPFTPGGWGIIDYEIKKGAIGFTGFRIGFFNSFFIGTASHVNVVNEFPG